MRNIFILAACFFLPILDSIAAADTRDLTLMTSDNVSIRTTLSTPREVAGKTAAVILIHQGGSNRHEWDFLVPALTNRNYVVLAYDVRGHGDSDQVVSMRKLFNDPHLAPLDLQAAIRFLQELPGVDANRLAVVGASIGANLAAMASSEYAIKTAVAISGKTSAVFNLAGKKNLAMRSVFFISSAGDQGGKRAIWANEMYDQTGEPRQLEIVQNSSQHGVGVFDDQPQLEQKILAWLSATL